MSERLRRSVLPMQRLQASDWRLRGWLRQFVRRREEASCERGGSRGPPSIADRPLVVPGLGRPDGLVFVSCFRFAGALEGLGRYVGVCRVDACVRRSLPAECLEA